MKIRHILAILALSLTGATGIQAQEYLNYYGITGNGYIPLDEIESVTVGANTSEVVAQLANDPSASLYYAALQATGLDTLIGNSSYDENYNSESYSPYYYSSDIWIEIATVPDYKIQGYTLFVTPDEVFRAHGINNLSDLTVKAKEIYDRSYPEYAGIFDDDYTHPKNPLNRFMRYTVLTCDVKDLNRLTGLPLYQGVVQGVLGVKTDLVNPTDWYQTLLPNTLMKCEQLTVSAYAGNGTINDFYINRRYDDKYTIEGAHISRELPQLKPATYNGHYYYVDDIVAFTEDVRDKVQNTRIRMDFSTVFPELTTLNIRQNGDPTKDDNMSVTDETFANGRNYYFPEGVLDGVTLRNTDGKFIYRRPHWNFWSYQGDEFNVHGDYDIEFRLPPVPYSGEWQIRLGFCARPNAGIAQVYFNGVPQGEPIDLQLYLDDESILGVNDRGQANFNYDYQYMTTEEKIAEQKLLKEKGYYRAPWSMYHTSGNSINHFSTNQRTYRRVLCEECYIDNTKEHYLRLQCVSESKLGNYNELQLDYIELVPKSVYNASELGGEMEDDL